MVLHGQTRAPHEMTSQSRIEEPVEDSGMSENPAICVFIRVQRARLWLIPERSASLRIERSDLARGFEGETWKGLKKTIPVLQSPVRRATQKEIKVDGPVKSSKRTFYEAMTI